MKINRSKDLRKACNLVRLGKTKTGKKEKAQKRIPNNYILEPKHKKGFNYIAHATRYIIFALLKSFALLLFFFRYLKKLQPFLSSSFSNYVAALIHLSFVRIFCLE